jgi:putative phosphoserine phosphatase/1-acylglycerol-3-phosphate O-acyltransferase
MEHQAMSRFQHVTPDVDQSKGGRTTAAFFDFDGTLIAGFSVASFVGRKLLSGRMSPREVLEQLLTIGDYGLGRTDFVGLLTRAAASLRGTSDSALRDFAKEVFEKDLSANLYPESRALVEAHVRKGHTIVIVSSATQYQVEPAAAELGFDHILCTQLEVEDGTVTGKLAAPMCYGKGKFDAARRFAKEKRISLAKSYFYTDGSEDIPLLEAVGFPRPLNPDDALRKKARREGWPVQSFASRGLPSVTDITRTSLVYGALVGSFLAGVPAWLLNRSWQDLTNVAISTWGDFGSAVAGLDVQTTGEEHLWSQRPAVFIFNHQSATDALILSRLLRHDFTGVAKKEMKSNPLVGTVLGAVGTVFIDRSDKDKAIEALQPAVDSLKNGTSFAIAPEGRRSLGYKLGPFKKGAFHIAMQAGVPVVPIVIANSSDSMPKSGVIIRPASIDVTVLPPVKTTDWTKDTIDRHIDDIRQMFLKTLGQTRNVDVKLRQVK